MAHTVVKDKWYSDVRRSALIAAIGCEFFADGLVLKLWRTGQEYWKANRGGIPKHIFDLFPHGDHLVRVGLVVVEESFVFVRGSLEHLDWLRVANENASKAGKKSAEARQKKSGTAQPKPKKPRTTPEPPSNDSPTEVEPNSSTDERFYSYSPSPSLFSLENPPSGETTAPPTEELGEGQKVQQLLGHYAKLWKEKYNADAAISGKWAGNAKTLVRDQGIKKATLLVSTFMAMNETWFVKNRHRFDLIMTDLAKISHFAGTGKLITDTQLKQVDQALANKSAGEGAAAYFRNRGQQ